MLLTIYRRIFYNSKCYNQGIKQISSGVQVHSTGCNNSYLHRYVAPDDGRIGANQYNNSHNKMTAMLCASAYIGKQTDGTVAIYQTLPWDYRCWLSGSGSNGNANRLGYVGFEICLDNKKNADYFYDAVMTKSTALTAYLCTLFGVGILKVKDHKLLHEMGLASNHGDILHWLKLYGLTMDDYRAKVQLYILEGVNVTYIDCDDSPVLYTAICLSLKYLNIRAATSTNSNSIGRIPGGATLDVLELTNGEWVKIKYNSVIGYCMRSFIKKELLTLTVALDINQQTAALETSNTLNTEFNNVTINIDKDTAAKLYNALAEVINK